MQTNYVAADRPNEPANGLSKNARVAQRGLAQKADKYELIGFETQL